MFNDILMSNADAAETGENTLSDGRFQVCYRDLPAIFDRLDEFFSAFAGPGPGCLACRCQNSVPEAILLLWLLARTRDFLLLPRTGPKRQAGIDPPPLPGFCRLRLEIDPSAPGITLTAPASYIQARENPAFRDVPYPLAGLGGVFLRTSGSTAEPKMALHAPKNLAANAENCRARFGLATQDRVIIPVPIYHMYGLGAGFLPVVMAGASVSFLESTNIITYLDREKAFLPNVAFLTPVLCAMFLKARKNDYAFRLTVTAGDRITPSLYENYERRFGPLVNLYGSTELGAIATSILADPLQTRSQGALLPMPGVDTRFGTGAASGDTAELFCRHKSGFFTYVDGQGQDSGGLVDGWFKTQDLGRPLADNRFQVNGRTGYSMNRTGLLVAFLEVESLMEQGIPELDQVAVTAREEEGQRGKLMVALCLLKPGAGLGAADIRSRCFQIMMRHQVPDEVQVVKELPRLPNGKLDRQAMARLVNEKS